MNAVVFRASEECQPGKSWNSAQRAHTEEAELHTWPLGRGGNWRRFENSQLFQYWKSKKHQGWLRESGFILNFFRVICESLSVSGWAFHVPGDM